MLRDDLLNGARAIAQHTGLTERQVYHMADRKTLPIIRKGRRIFARRSELVD